MTWQPRLPSEIEAESFRRIEAQVGPHHLPPEVWFVVRRMIHTSADPEYLASARLHPRAIAAGVEALQRGCPVATDTRMLLAGISTGRLDRLGVTAFCLMDDPEVAAEAARRGTTRAEVAMERSLPRLAGGIVAIGNAPTALLRLLELLAAGAPPPALVVGVPVGFVNAAESKDALARQDCPYITALGPKGGSAAGGQHRECPGHHGPGGGAVMTTKTGTLYGIGVGPGDPELITLKALKVLQRGAPHLCLVLHQEHLQPGPEHRAVSPERRRHRAPALPHDQGPPGAGTPPGSRTPGGSWKCWPPAVTPPSSPWGTP